MKNKKGITLVILIIYIMVLILVIGVMSSITINFSKNTKFLQQETIDLIEFNNFNEYFIKEIKTANNSIDKIDEIGTYILFTTGNSFTFKDGSIFYNGILISKNVKNIKFEYDKDNEGKEVKNIIKLTVEYTNFSKEMKYKVEEIY